MAKNKAFQVIPAMYWTNVVCTGYRQ
jgi:hypothetical protein